MSERALDNVSSVCVQCKLLITWQLSTIRMFITGSNNKMIAYHVVACTQLNILYSVCVDEYVHYAWTWSLLCGALLAVKTQMAVILNQDVWGQSRQSFIKGPFSPVFCPLLFFFYRTQPPPPTAFPGLSKTSVHVRGVTVEPCLKQTKICYFKRVARFRYPTVVTPSTTGEKS